jgi:hypothetical protein
MQFSDLKAGQFFKFTDSEHIYMRIHNFPQYRCEDLVMVDIEGDLDDSEYVDFESEIILVNAKFENF